LAELEVIEIAKSKIGIGILALAVLLPGLAYAGIANSVFLSNSQINVFHRILYSVMIALPYRILLCFYGYKHLSKVMVMLGILFGFLALFGIAIRGHNSNALVLSVVLLLLSVAFAILCIRIHQIGVSIIGLISGLIAVLVLTRGSISTILALVIGLICSVLALVIKKKMIIILTANMGAFLLPTVFAGYIRYDLVILVYIGIFLLGVFIQNKVTAKNAPEDIEAHLLKKEISDAR